MDAPDRTTHHAEVGLDESHNYLTETIGRFVPQFVVRRAVDVNISISGREYEQGAPVMFRVILRNRLPIPVAIQTPRPRLWGWRIDEYLEGSDERQYLAEHPNRFAFRGGERKVIDVTWSGRFESDGTWTPAPVGTHELVAFVATKNKRPHARIRFDVV